MSKRELNYHPLTLWNIPDDHHFFREDGSGLYSYMFIEDVTNHITPYRTYSSTRSDKAFGVNISNPSLETEAKVLFHRPYENEPFHQSLGEVIFDFIRDTAGFLLGKGGRAYFEIVDATLEEEVSKSMYVLKPIHGKVVKFGKTYYQIVPREMQETKERHRAVPQSKIWLLQMSRDLGGSKDVVSLANNFYYLGKASFIDSEILMNQEKIYGFDVSDFHSMIDALVLKASSKWGWDMRMGISNQHALEYYLYYRLLRFGYSMAILRTDMLSKMNGLLSRLGFDATLSFSGIPAPEEFLDVLKKMEHRQLSFKQASDLVYFHL